MLSKHNRQACDDGVADRQADAESQQEAAHLVASVRVVTHQRIADAVQGG